MKRYILIFTIFILFLSFLFAQKDPKTLEFPDIEFAPRKPGLAAVKEGVTFYFQEDYESPVIEGMLIFKSGSLYEPSGKEGLASLTMRMLKAGGTKTFTPDMLEDKLDFPQSFRPYLHSMYSLTNFLILSGVFHHFFRPMSSNRQELFNCGDSVPTIPNHPGQTHPPVIVQPS